MKKITIFLTLFVSLLLSSCSDNDNSTDLTITENELIGDWKITDIYTENGEASITTNGVTLNGTYSMTAKDYNINMSFTDNPKKVTTNGSVTTITSTTFLGQTQTQEQPSGDVPNTSGTWSLNKNILSISGAQESGELTIVSYNNNTLVLKQNLNTTQSLGLQEFKITGNLYVTLTK